MMQQASVLGSAGRYFFATDDAAITEIDSGGLLDNEIEVGSRVHLGPYELTFEEGPPGFDFRLSVELVTPLDDGGFRMRTAAKRLSEAAPRMVLLSALAGIVFAALLIGWPLFEAYRSQPPTVADKAVSEKTTPLPAALRGWESGPLSASHHFLSNACTSCHMQQFGKPPNESCLACHDKAEHHVDPEDFELPAVQKGSCIACHREHRTDQQLVIRDEAFCVSCHADLKQVVAETELGNVGAGVSGHPPFKATVVTDASTGQRTRQPLSLKTGIKEKSNLRFPHHVHVAKQGIKVIGTDKVRKLACADCHTPDAGGRSMQPIDMKSHCESCHKLKFDPAAKDRTLPHASPKAVHALIYDFYLAQEAQKARDRLEYGTSTAPVSGKDTELHRALGRAEERQAGIVEFVFKSVCGTCHEPVELAKEGDLRWTVEPVLLADHWYPKARFDHGSHRTVDCGHCHSAKTSTKSSDILIPGLDNCLECHGSAGQASRVPTTCGTCHEFHVEGLPAMARGEDDE